MVSVSRLAPRLVRIVLGGSGLSDFVVHGDLGTAGRWTNNAKVGDLAQFTGPGGGFVVDSTADWFLMAGDESALPAIASTLEHAPADKPIKAVILVDDRDHELKLTSLGILTVT